MCQCEDRPCCGCHLEDDRSDEWDQDAFDDRDGPESPFGDDDDEDFDDDTFFGDEDPW